MGRARADVLLLAGQHAAAHAALQHGFLHLEREQAQGRQIYAAPGLGQAVQAVIGLARVGAADVDDKAALHHARRRILVLGIDRDEVGELAADLGRDVIDEINLVERAVQQLARREIRHGQQLAGGHRLAAAGVLIQHDRSHAHERGHVARAHARRQCPLTLGLSPAQPRRAGHDALGVFEILAVAHIGTGHLQHRAQAVLRLGGRARARDTALLQGGQDALMQAAHEQHGVRVGLGHIGERLGVKGLLERKPAQESPLTPGALLLTAADLPPGTAAADALQHAAHVRPVLQCLDVGQRPQPHKLLAVLVVRVAAAHGRGQLLNDRVGPTARVQVADGQPLVFVGFEHGVASGNERYNKSRPPCQQGSGRNGS